MAVEPTTEAIRLGREALARGAWEEARRAFEAALVQEETAEALEGLGAAAWWLDDARLTFEAREHAYRLYSERGDRCAAARVATAIAWDYEAFRGELAVAQGWLARARRQLEGLEVTPEHGWLALREGEIALRADTGEARRLAVEGAAVGRKLGSLDIEMTGLALEGLALVSEGQVEHGMRLLDEATAAAMSGELTDLQAIGITCCRLIVACDRVGDYDRAAQWCSRMDEFARRWQIRSLLGVCRTAYASVLLERGSWDEAETTLLEAREELELRRPALAPGAVARLGELRRRQGRLDEAAALLAEAGGHPLAVLGRAELALDHGDREAATELARSFLRRLAPEDRLGRGGGLELLVRIDPASERARAALSELKQIARQIATPPLRAAAGFAEALSVGDAEGVEAAVDLFEAVGQPFEAARARVELARLSGEARHERAAREALDRLGVRRDNGGPLSAREAEVLRLVAEGLSDREIAARLVLSEHTVHRHVANVRTKLRQPSRAAAAAYAARNGLL
jgi:LuxR family maltose regulon positive regulatory protein